MDKLKNIVYISVLAFIVVIATIAGFTSIHKAKNVSKDTVEWVVVRECKYPIVKIHGCQYIACGPAMFVHLGDCPNPIHKH